MNINQIRYVLEVASSSSMRAASTKLYVSQPALSASIRELEEELGILIFERTNKGISLTDEGREFVSYAKKAISQYEILEERYLSKDGGKERFSVSTQHYNFAIKAFTDTIKLMDPEKYVFSIHETKTKEVLEDVVPLMKCDTYIYVWKDHKYAGRKTISLEEMKDYPCVSFDQTDDSNFYLTEEAMADYDFGKMIKSDDRATTMEIIADLSGYSVGSGMLSGDDAILQGLVSIKLEEEDPLTIGYITRKGSSLSVYGEAYVKKLLDYKGWIIKRSR